MILTSTNGHTFKDLKLTIEAVLEQISFYQYSNYTFNNNKKTENCNLYEI